LGGGGDGVSYEGRQLTTSTGTRYNESIYKFYPNRGVTVVSS